MPASEFIEIVDNIVKSKVEFETKHSSLVEAVLEKLSENESRIAMVDCDSGRQWTACKMRSAILTLGVQFARQGISKNDVVAFYCPNSDLQIIAMFAVMSIGGIYTGLIHKNPLRELENVVTSSGASYLIGCVENFECCKEFVSKSNTIKKLFVIDDYNCNTNLTSISTLLDNEIEESENEKIFKSLRELKLERMCKTNFSSGTTGKPKAVISINKNCIANKLLDAPGIDLMSSNDVVACIAHIAHGGGSSILFMALLKGLKCVIFSHFESKYFVENVQKYSVTFAFLVPSYLNLMNREISEPIQSFKLKKVLVAGEVLSKRIGEDFIEKFKPDYFGQGYGSTEMGWATVKPSVDGVQNIMTSGIPTGGLQVKIIDLETRKALSVNQKGEIFLKGPQVVPGYLNNISATVDAFDENGFFKSGDLGYFDENGYLYCVGRIKDTLKYNGLQVSAFELECLLLEHESVKEAAVVGIPDEVYGELPKAFVVLKKKFNNNVSENDLIQFVNERVAEHKKLRGLVFIQSLPKTILGKIDKKALKLL